MKEYILETQMFLFANMHVYILCEADIHNRDQPYRYTEEYWSLQHPRQHQNPN